MKLYLWHWHRTLWLLGALLCAERPAAADLAPAAATVSAGFPAPGESIEPLAAEQPLPFVPLLPGMQVTSWRIDQEGLEAVPSPSKTTYMMPPLVRISYGYEGKPRLGAPQRLAAYRRGLGAAGWQLEALAGRGSGVAGRYIARGRNIWLKLLATTHGVELVLWEPAAGAQTAALREALTKQGRVRLYGIAFETNKSVLRLESVASLRPILPLVMPSDKDKAKDQAKDQAEAKNAPPLTLEIQVHTDNSFRDVYDRRPSHDRARTLRAWLIANGADPARLVARGYGESVPVAPNTTPEGRARNRRVELVPLH